MKRRQFGLSAFALSATSGAACADVPVQPPEGPEVRTVAQPTKADATFFPARKTQMPVRPVCWTGAGWPADITAVGTHSPVCVVALKHPIGVTGTPEFGARFDGQRVCPSRVRVADARYERG